MCSMLQLGGLGHAPRKFLKNSYKIESGGNFSPTICKECTHYGILYVASSDLVFISISTGIW